MASIYYTCCSTNQYGTPAEIVFRNSNYYKENNSVEDYDYALFRFNIIAQTAKRNNDPAEPNFSRSCSGNMQIYPTTFSTTNRILYLNNSYFDGTEIVNNDVYTITDPHFPNGRNIYFTDSILDNITNEFLNSLTIECQKINGSSYIRFNFAPYDPNMDNCPAELLIIYSINIELLNNGKIPIHLISTNNFQINI